MSTFQPPAFTWMNGELVPYADSRIHINTDAVLRGASVFEGLRAYRTADGDDLSLIRPMDHLDRLFGTSMKVLRMEIPYSPPDLVEAIVSLVRANDLHEDSHVRLVVYFASAELGDDTDATGTFVMAYPRPQNPRLSTGISSTISPWRRVNEGSMPPRVKASANYLNGRLASRDARAKGFDVPIQLNEQGKVSEGPGQNVFLVREGRLITPRLTDSILEGITREAVLEIAGEQGIEVEIRQVDPTELYVADELFFAGTLSEIQPIVDMDHYRVGKGGMGPITSVIQQAYLGIVRGGAAHADWRHSIYR